VVSRDTKKILDTTEKTFDDVSGSMQRAVYRDAWSTARDKPCTGDPFIDGFTDSVHASRNALTVTASQRIVRAETFKKLDC
jgi:hypothetical protein